MTILRLFWLALLLMVATTTRVTLAEEEEEEIIDENEGYYEHNDDEYELRRCHCPCDTEHGTYDEDTENFSAYDYEGHHLCIHDDENFDPHFQEGSNAPGYCDDSCLYLEDNDGNNEEL
ncbi:expressed unknown protein [Seminavis robusta]|uniref:Uncharacterized protein n=1 Tax=Seminavis robusta TaxID=568900 RepID=A0A9N8EQV3_9STRA|nr:expressed unknown protein [Seminavis robusta]|eukprot:Sro1633_g287380.1 n/a (119) ;mRNA; f:10631-10987